MAGEIVVETHGGVVRFGPYEAIAKRRAIPPGPYMPFSWKQNITILFQKRALRMRECPFRAVSIQPLLSTWRCARVRVHDAVPQADEALKLGSSASEAGRDSWIRMTRC